MAIVLALLLAGEAAYLLFVRGTDQRQHPAAGGDALAARRHVGRALFNQYLLPFEITSILLLVAMVGAIVLARQGKGGR